MQQSKLKKQLNNVLIVVMIILTFVVLHYAPRFAVGLENYWSANHLDQQIKSQQPLVLLDVRTPAEFKTGHLQGAINMPMQALEQSLADPQARFIKQHSDKTVVMICLSGSRANKATRWLQSNGLKTQVKILDGGMNAWRGAKLAVVR